jgi:hypothetical protein
MSRTDDEINNGEPEWSEVEWARATRLSQDVARHRRKGPAAVDWLPYAVIAVVLVGFWFGFALAVNAIANLIGGI